MQQAENKYYKIREELNKKYFNNEGKQEEINEENSSSKYKEMISYLEQLNNVLTEILKSSRIEIKKKNCSKNSRAIIPRTTKNE